MNQHFVPESYLRRWSGPDGRVFRYRRIGHNNRLKLEGRRYSPSILCQEHNLYTLPPHLRAWGLGDNDIEHMFARHVEPHVSELLREIGEIVGPLESQVGSRLRWLMQTFVARTPSSLHRMEREAAVMAKQHEQLVRNALERSMPDEFRREFETYLSPDGPAFIARSVLAPLVGTKQRPQNGWLEGNVYVVRNQGNPKKCLTSLGLSHFPTYDAPVIEWDKNEAGIVAAFALEPSTLIVVVQDALPSDWEVVLSYCMQPIKMRREVICTERAIDGHWTNEVQNLRPWTEPLAANVADSRSPQSDERLMP